MKLNQSENIPKKHRMLKMEGKASDAQNHFW